MIRSSILLLVTAGLLTAPLLLSGCGTEVKRVGTDTDINLSGNWNDADAKQTADTLIASSMKSPWAESFAKDKGRKPVVKVGRVTTRTNGDVVNTAIFSTKISDALVNSGKAEVVADANDAEQIRQERAEQEKNASADSRKESFQETGADFLMTGSIEVQDDQADGKKVKFYQVSMRLVDITTGKRVWTDRHELKKYVER